ncbi:MAG TPA: hypothetical protein VMW40_04305 [Candidatus Bathyarchaeia archaeon]|nr:hypothetical protein [Candidatus Bathyarchaeia archaeon]
MKGHKYKVEFFPIEKIQVKKEIDKGKIEETLNKYAEKGWRLRETALCGQLGLICIFEK